MEIIYQIMAAQAAEARARGPLSDFSMTHNRAGQPYYEDGASCPIPPGSGGMPSDPITYGIEYGRRAAMRGAK